MIKINETNVTIMINDMYKSIEFYWTIGFDLKQRWKNHYAMMTTMGLTIGFHPKDEEPNSSGSISIGFIVDDLMPIKEILGSKKIPFTERPGKAGDFINFKDLDNTALYFTKLSVT